MCPDSTAPEEASREASLDDLLVVEAGGRRFALAAVGVEEVLPLPRITPLPGAAAAVRGLFTHRGELIVAADAASLLGEPSRHPGPSARLLLMRQGRQATGILVDAVSGIVRFEQSALRGAAGLPSESLALGLVDWEGDTVCWLELGAFLKEMDARLAKRA